MASRTDNMDRAGISLTLSSLPVVVAATAEDLGARLAEKIIADLNLALDAGRRYVIGCPGGRSLVTTYRALGNLISQNPVDLSNLVIAMMDDYVVSVDGTLTFCPPDAHFSCRRFAQEEIVEVLNKGISKEYRIVQDNVWFPEPSDPSAYDDRLSTTGGVDIFLIAAGSSDGHVAFNPPGSGPESISRVIELPESTRRDNMRTFPSFKSLAEVPKYGVSVGLGTISTLSREVVLVMHGAEKRLAVKQLSEHNGFTSTWPASIIFKCQRPKLYLDAVAAHDLLGA